MTKLYVPITNEEFTQLAQLAQRECRSPRDQARAILRQVLLGNSDHATKTPTPAPEAQIDLRRQLAEVQEDEVILISERDAAEKEAAELRAKYNELWRENEANALANIDLRRRLDAVPVVAILECIGPDDYDFTAPTLTVLEFANWLEAERAARI